MVSLNNRVWSDRWALKLGRDPETFARAVETINISTATNQEVAKALGVTEMMASYIKRGLHRFGMKHRTPAHVGRKMAMPALIRIHHDYQKLVDEEVSLENRLLEIRKDLEKYSPIAHAFKALQEATSKITN